MRECGACDNCLQEAPLAVDEAAAPSTDRRSRRATPAPAAASAVLQEVAAPEPFTPEAQALYERLRELRSRLAREAGLPAYCVFADRTLQELVRRRPTTSAEMLGVSGVGPAKLERYGTDFLRLLRGEGAS